MELRGMPATAWADFGNPVHPVLPHRFEGTPRTHGVASQVVPGGTVRQPADVRGVVEAQRLVLRLQRPLLEQEQLHRQVLRVLLRAVRGDFVLLVGAVVVVFVGVVPVTHAVHPPYPLWSKREGPHRRNVPFCGALSQESAGDPHHPPSITRAGGSAPAGS
jgi:hypothetical protein